MIKVKHIGFILFFVIVVIILIFSNLVNLDITNNQRPTNILTPTITKRPTLIVTNTLIPTRTAIISETISPILTVSPTPTVTQKVTATTLSMIRPKDGAEMLEVDSYSGAVLRMVTSDEFPEIENDLMGVNYIVLISDILMDRYEVTNQQFATFLNDYGNQIDGTVAWYDANDYDARIEYDGNKWKVLDNYEDHPVTEVTWYGAEAYCEAMGGRLPNELEMQGAGANIKNWNIVDYAGFAGFTAIIDAGIYPWGYEKPDNTFLNFDMNVGDTVPVGSYPLGANPVGIMDLSGNVREWMLNWYTKNYSQGHVTNEGTKGPFDGEYRSIRGGSWQDDAENVLVLKRDYALPSVSENDLGFRCVYSEFTNRPRK